MDYECMRCGDIGYVLTYVGGAPPTQEDVPCPDCGPCGVRFEWARRCVRDTGHEGAHTDDVRESVCPGPASPQTMHRDVPNPGCPECGGS